MPQLGIKLANTIANCRGIFLTEFSGQMYTFVDKIQVNYLIRYGDNLNTFEKGKLIIAQMLEIMFEGPSKKK